MSSKRLRFLNYRSALLISLFLIVPLGYLVRFAQAGPAWLHDALGSVAYEIFWILLVVLLMPTASPAWAAIAVCLATCGLEVLQLWQHPILQAMRATLIGRLVLGNTFTWSDFPAYFVGSALGWVWVRSLKHQFLRRRTP
ncbi:MAG: hypothetical protein Kow00121_24880 [Elainellaceae cyanobacterium]